MTSPLHDYIADMAKRSALAEAVGKNPNYLWQIGTGRRTASPKLAQAIHDFTKGKVPRASMRPDLWGRKPAA